MWRRRDADGTDVGGSYPRCFRWGMRPLDCHDHPDRRWRHGMRSTEHEGCRSGPRELTLRSRCASWRPRGTVATKVGLMLLLMPLSDRIRPGRRQGTNDRGMCLTPRSMGTSQSADEMSRSCLPLPGPPRTGDGARSLQQRRSNACVAERWLYRQRCVQCSTSRS